MKIPIHYEIPWPRPLRFHILTHIESHEVEYFLLKRFGRQFWANDEDFLKKESCRSNIGKLYKILKIPPKSKYVSGYVHTRDFTCEFGWNYGNICLILDLERIKEKTVIFNGDLKNLAYKLFVLNASTRNFLRYHHLSEHHTDIFVSLQRYYWNYMFNCLLKKQCNPRMIGCYYEARIFRPIVQEDIEMIVIPRDSDSAVKGMAEKLATV
ncbi:hypothetical protein KBA41_02140 [Candidatus Ozemobacteraceae bacterium]|nr:hypothetical protein [Candidatus Ozemobacteraceae bacterium]